MIWIILTVLGVPLWLCAAALILLALRNRTMRRRPGNVAVRVRRSGSKRWQRGHAIWVHDVFAFRGSPAAWEEGLDWVRELTVRPLSPDEEHKLRRVSAAVVVDLRTDSGETLSVATPGEHADALAGPFAGPAELKELHPA